MALRAADALSLTLKMWTPLLLAVSRLIEAGKHSKHNGNTMLYNKAFRLLYLLSC